MIKTITATTLLSILSLFSCNRSAGPTESEKALALAERRERFSGMIHNSYAIKGTFASPEEAVEEFVNSLVKNGPAAAGSHLYSEKEFLEIYWPNESEEFNMIYAVPPEAAWSMQNAIRSAILPVLAGRFWKVSGRYRVSELKFKAHVKRNSLTLHLPERIVLRSGTHEVSVSEIRIIIEHGGRYRIASIWKEAE